MPVPFFRNLWSIRSECEVLCPDSVMESSIKEGKKFEFFLKSGIKSPQGEYELVKSGLESALFPELRGRGVHSKGRRVEHQFMPFKLCLVRKNMEEGREKKKKCKTKKKESLRSLQSCATKEAYPGWLCKSPNFFLLYEAWDALPSTFTHSLFLDLFYFSKVEIFHNLWSAIGPLQFCIELSSQSTLCLGPFLTDFSFIIKSCYLFEKDKLTHFVLHIKSLQSKEVSSYLEI